METMLWCQNVIAAFVANVVAGNFSGPLNGTYLIAIDQPFALDPTLDLAGVSEASFAGYARQALGPWSAPYIPPGVNGWSVDAAPAYFIAGAIVGAATIYGLAIVTAAVGGHILGAVLLNPAPTLNAPGVGFRANVQVVELTTFPRMNIGIE